MQKCRIECRIAQGISKNLQHKIKLPDKIFDKRSALQKDMAQLTQIRAKTIDFMFEPDS